MIIYWFPGENQAFIMDKESTTKRSHQEQFFSFTKF